MINKIVLTGVILLANILGFSQEKPNILFIAIDDMKPLIGAYGEKAITPNLDALIKGGTVFKNAYCQFPVCGPSRASIMTGLRPEETGILDLKTKMRDVNPNVLSLPQHFKNNGYTTVARGKIYDPRCVESRQTDDPQSWSIPFKQTHGIADKYNKYGRLAVKSIDEPENDFTDAKINNESIELLNQLSKDDNPFFLAVGFKKPHLPFFAPKKYFDLYDREKFELEKDQKPPKGCDPSFTLNNNGELLSYHPIPIEGEEAKYQAYKHGGHLSKKEQLDLLHGYYACVSFIDAQIGKLVKSLKESGEYDNTIIVLWGDHGFHLGDHGMWGKHTTMEQSARVPLVFSGKSIKPQISSEVVELIDVFPTLVELTGLEVPSNLSGKSFKNVLTENSKSKGYAITQYKRKGAFGYSLRTEKYRYTEWVNKEGKVLYRDLYDINDLYLEEENIVDSVDSQTIRELSEILKSKKEELKRYN